MGKGISFIGSCIFSYVTSMIVRAFTVGNFGTNCYTVNCEKTGEAVVIDPGFSKVFEAEEMFAHIKNGGLKPRFIVNTHGHPDHTCGNGLVKEKFHVPLFIHEGDARMLGDTGRILAKLMGFSVSSPEADKFVREEEVLEFGNESFRVIHTPGHSPGGICLLASKECFTGDTLFAGSIGRTDLPGGSNNEMLSSLRKIAGLAGDLVVYPGHGPKTTIETERRSNPFLQW